MKILLTVSLRQQAIFIPETALTGNSEPIAETTSVLVANLSKLGFGVSEALLKALNRTTPDFKLHVLDTFREVMGVRKNWTPLVKGWDTPTGESILDHIVTFFGNIFKDEGTALPCGHIIPPNTFPLERYNGCPFCGTPFEFGQIEKYKQGSDLKILELWTEQDAANFFSDLLTSKTALDATQIDSLKTMLSLLPVPDVKIGMKETLMTVIDTYVEQDNAAKAQSYFTSPTDILRYVWYKQTGFLQIIEPKTIIKRIAQNNKHMAVWLDTSAGAVLQAKAKIKLKFQRKECRVVAEWLNNMPLDADKMCEIMHPKRNMWVRFIRALRLAEYSKRKGFENLAVLLDVFYKEEYQVWQGKVDHYRLRYDVATTMSLLKQRPGLFARSLFANMLWFGPETTTAAFGEIIDKVPARLVFSLNMYAANYFDKKMGRYVKPLGGNSKAVPANGLLGLYDEDQLQEMKASVEDLCILAVKKRFAARENTNKSIYIDPMLFKMPVSIGDRSDSVQDLPSALMGTRFPLEGSSVRLFMQWGQGLPAQHLDMDLSCQVAYEGKTEACAFNRLVIAGCKHSGDIRQIPHKIGTAEYIEIDIDTLQKANAKYVTFTCNAYSNGSITPNLVVGWMNSKQPMHISEITGVAYDPSCVQQQVRITNGVTKGSEFGELDVAQREIVWLEMPFGGQVVSQLSKENVDLLLNKLDSKISVGRLLTIKAEAQNLTMTETEDAADEVYTKMWASNTAAVTKLLID